MTAKKKPPVMKIKIRGRWLACSLYEALTERSEVMRCKYCHGPVQALRNRAQEPEPTLNPSKVTPVADFQLARSAESNPNIHSR